MFFVYDNVVMSSSMREHRVLEFKNFMNRAKRNKNIYDERFKSVYRFFTKVFENY